MAARDDDYEYDYGYDYDNDYDTALFFCYMHDQARTFVTHELS